MEEIRVVSIDQAYEDLKKSRGPDRRPRKRRRSGGRLFGYKGEEVGHIKELPKELPKGKEKRLIAEHERAQGYLKHGRINQGVATWEGAKKRFNTK